MSFEDLAERYYGAVRRHLEERGIWEETIKRFPPAAVRGAVERILERLDENNVDPELLDWGALFEGLKDYGSVEAFIKDLEAKRYIPASVEEAARASADEAERELLELLEAARAADPSVLERLRSRLDEMLGRGDELMKLRAELAELKRAAHRDRALVEAYSKRVKELEAQLARLRAEAEALRREAARPKVPWPPPVPTVSGTAVEALVAEEMAKWPEAKEYLEAHRLEVLVEALKRVPERVRRDYEAALARGALYREAEALRSARHEVGLVVGEFAERARARPPAPEVAVVWRERGYTVMLPEPRVVG